MFEESTWLFINSFAAWFSAAGTLAAVIISLYLARQDKMIRLAVEATYITTKEITEENREPNHWIMITATNLGRRETEISYVGWKAGFLRARYATQEFSPDLSNALPIRLRDGEVARYFIAVKGEKNGLLDLREHMIQKNARIMVWTLRARVINSLGRVFSARVSRSLRKELLMAVHEARSDADRKGTLSIHRSNQAFIVPVKQPRVNRGETRQETSARVRPDKR